MHAESCITEPRCVVCALSLIKNTSIKVLTLSLDESVGHIRDVLATVNRLFKCVQTGMLEQVHVLQLSRKKRGEQIESVVQV